MNGQPLGIKKTIRLMIALTILAWATQTLLSQWGYGAEPVEHFVPPANGMRAGAVLELRAEATIYGDDVLLKQISRWADSDAAMFAPIADLKVTRFDSQTPFRGISVQELKDVLHDAGVNLGVIEFAGATTCTVGRADVSFNEAEALQQWVAAKNPEAAAAFAPIEAPAATENPQPAAASMEAAGTSVVTDSAEAHNRSLREILLADLATRLNLPVETLQVQFDPRDENALKLVEPHFTFHVAPRRVNNLGQVSWEAQVITGQGIQRLNVSATARAWQNQIVLSKPVSFKQIIREDDIITRRTLVDRLDDEPLLTAEQAIGQQAARELKPGAVLTARMVDAVPLVRTGQLVSILLRQGNVQVKTVARALEGGVYGQTIRVRNEGTKDVFPVTLTGPQTGVMGGEGELSSNLAASAQ